LLRFRHGLFLLNTVARDTKATKEQLAPFSDLTLQTYLFEGLRHPGVCSLVELYFETCPLGILESRNRATLLANTSHYLPSDSITVFFAKRLLGQAFQDHEKSLKLPQGNERQRMEQRVAKLKADAASELRQNPLGIELGVALDEMLKCNMVLESVRMCVEIGDKVEELRVMAEQEEEVLPLFSAKIP